MIKIQTTSIQSSIGCDNELRSEIEQYIEHVNFPKKHIFDKIKMNIKYFKSKIKEHDKLSNIVQQNILDIQTKLQHNEYQINELSQRLLREY